MTAWGYRSWVPVYALAAAAVVIGLLAAGTRRGERGAG
jgi:hypothetical protein